MAEIDISEEAVKAQRVQLVHEFVAQKIEASLGQNIYDMIGSLRDALTTAEAARDEVLAKVEIAKKAAQDYCWQRYKGREPMNLKYEAVFTSHEWQKIGEAIDAALGHDTAAAAREYRARIEEECADIAAATTITDHDNLNWTDGRRVAVEAIRAHAAKVREGRG